LSARPRRPAKPSLIVKFPSQTSYLALVRDLTKKMAETAGFPEATADRIALAVDEATTNVIEHAYAGRDDEEVELRFEDRGPDFRVEIADTGQMVDPRAVPQVDLAKYATERRTGGLGNHLIETLMDAEPVRRSPRRIVCALVKRKEDAP
jgi:anti-sigma regulatory factor (Ser/Thr protein kinase)